MIRSLTEVHERRRRRWDAERHVAAGHVQGKGDDGRSRNEGQVGKGILITPSPFLLRCTVHWMMHSEKTRRAVNRRYCVLNDPQLFVHE